MLRVVLFAVALMFVPKGVFAATAHGYLGVFGGALLMDGMEAERARPLIYTLGYRVSSLWAFQFEYSDAKPFRGTVKKDSHSTPYARDIEYTTSGAYLMFIRPMGSWVDVNVKYGYVQVDYSFDELSQQDSAKERFSFSGESYGGGVTLKMTNSLVFTVDYTQFRTDTAQLSAGVEFDL